MSAFSDGFRTWRRKFKASLPYVRRREHSVLQKKYADLIEAIDGHAPLAGEARLHIAKPPQGDTTGEVCLFVTYADEPRIKPHVLAHVAHLQAAGIRVIVIVNTDFAAAEFTIDPGLRAGASGIAIRQNTGYDFGAWAHVLSLCPNADRWARLYLVNDSIVGPLNAADFEQMLARIRASKADVLGLTEALAPVPHLQSYFLVFNARTLRSGALQHVVARVRNWPAKIQVIDVCESRLTAVLEAQGLRCEALFASLSGDPLSSDDTSLRWAELVRSGFPYLKTRVIASHPNDPQIKAWLGARGAAPSPVPDAPG